MGKAPAQIRFPDGKICYSIFHSESVYPLIFNSLAEFNAHRDVDKKDGLKDGCLCNPNQEEEVEIASSYGGGFHWKGKACRDCMRITENCCPWPDIRESATCAFVDSFQEDLPEWWNENMA